MDEVLGIVASARTWGNGELLVRRVLAGARAEGSAVRLLRLTDLRLETCTGCMRCAIGRKPCPLDDDLAWLLETMLGAGGLVLSAPTYFLGPSAVFKLVLDRLLMLATVPGAASPPLRPAVTIVTAGLEKWRGLTLPYLNALVAAVGCRPIDSLLAVAPGPGEVLLDEPLLDRAHAAGCRLGRGETDAIPAALNVCPTCRCDVFVLSGSRATCPICGRQAAIRHEKDGVRLEFEASAGAESRWSPEGLQRHIAEWVGSTGPRFVAHHKEIKARRAALLQNG